MDFIINLPLITIILGFVLAVLTSFLNEKVSRILTLCYEALAIVFGILLTVIRKERMIKNVSKKNNSKKLKKLLTRFK